MAEEWIVLNPEDAAEMEAIYEAVTEVVRRYIKDEANFTGRGVTI